MKTIIRPTLIAAIALLVALGGPFTLLGTGCGLTALWCLLTQWRRAQRLVMAR